MDYTFFPSETSRLKDIMDFLATKNTQHHQSGVVESYTFLDCRKTFRGKLLKCNKGAKIVQIHSWTLTSDFLLTALG